MTDKDVIAIKIPEIAKEVQVGPDEWAYLDKDGNVVGGRHTVTYPDLNAPKRLETAVVEAAIGWSYQVVCESVADDALLAAVTALLKARGEK